MSGDLPTTDLLYHRLGLGRDNAFPIGWFAEHLHLSRREVEQAIQQLRLDGKPIASGPDGVWLTNDPADLWATYSGLRGRIASQSATAWAVRRTLRRMRADAFIQEELFPAA